MKFCFAVEYGIENMYMYIIIYYISLKMTTYEILDLILSAIWLILWWFALNEGVKYVKTTKDSQNIWSQKQTSQWDRSPNIGRDLNQK